MEIAVLYQFNEKYAPYAGISLTSLLENNKHVEKVQIYVLGEGLSPKSVEKFQQTVKHYARTITFVETEMLIAKMKAMNMPTYRGSYAANMRLFLPEVLDKTVHRLLYLDADTIVEGELDDLFSMSMENKAIAMIQDSLVRKHKMRLGFDREEPYYNSGVILFDMDEWRKCKYSQKIVEHVQKVRANYPSPDQDLLNVVCHKEIMTLPPKYNLQPIHLAFSTRSYYKCFRGMGYYSSAEIEEGRKKPVICHFFRFVGEFPWNSNNVHPDNERFDRYLKMSCWRDYKKNPAEVGSILKLEKVIYKIMPRSIFIYLFRFAYECFIYKANKDSLRQKINKMM